MLRSQLLVEPKSRQAGQPAFSYKDNNNFKGKQGMNIMVSGLAHSPIM